MFKIILSGSNPFDEKKVTGIGAVINVLLENKEVKYHLIPLGRSSNQKHDFKWVKAQLSMFINILKAAFNKEYPLAHVNTCTNPSAILRDAFIVFVFSISRKKIILHMHGGKYLFEPPNSIFLKTLFNYTCSRSKIIMVLSEFEKNQSVLSSKYHSKLRVLKNCINSNKVPEVKLKQKKLHDILFVGRITESKGIEDLLKALKVLSKQRNDFRFILCGSGDLAEETVAELEKIKELQFEFKGIVLGEEKWNTLADSGIFILPSRHGEGLPIALIEAMATKSICVVTDDASMRQVIIDGKNGVLIKKYSPEDIVLKLNQLLDDEMRMKEIANNAYDYYVKNFKMENYLKTVNSYYKELIEA